MAAALRASHSLRLPSNSSEPCSARGGRGATAPRAQAGHGSYWPTQPPQRAARPAALPAAQTAAVRRPPAAVLPTHPPSPHLHVRAVRHLVVVVHRNHGHAAVQLLQGGVGPAGQGRGRRSRGEGLLSVGGGGAGAQQPQRVLLTCSRPGTASAARRAWPARHPAGHTCSRRGARGSRPAWRSGGRGAGRAAPAAPWTDTRRPRRIHRCSRWQGGKVGVWEALYSGRRQPPVPRGVPQSLPRNPSSRNFNLAARRRPRPHPQCSTKSRRPLPFPLNTLQPQAPPAVQHKVEAVDARQQVVAVEAAKAPAAGGVRGGSGRGAAVRVQHFRLARGPLAGWRPAGCQAVPPAGRPHQLAQLTLANSTSSGCWGAVRVMPVGLRDRSGRWAGSSAARSVCCQRQDLPPPGGAASPRLTSSAPLPSPPRACAPCPG